MTTEQTLPSDADAEQAVLGCIIVDGHEAFDLSATAGVCAESFTEPMFASVWNAMSALSSNNRAIDLRTVTDEMRSQNTLTPSVGIVLDACVDAAFAPSNLVSYCEIVQEQLLYRRVILTTRMNAMAAYSQREPAEQIRSQAEFALAELQSDTHRQREPSEIIEARCKVWEQARERGCAGIPTGFGFLDKGFGGLMDAGVYFFSGPPKCCKTTLAINICENVAQNAGLPVAICTLEQTEDMLWGTIAATYAGESVFHLNSGNRNADPDVVRHKAIGVVNKWPITIDDTPKTVTTLWSWARKQKSKGARLLVLDYLQLITPTGKEASEERRISEASMACTRIAKSLRIPFIVISNESQAGTMRHSSQMQYDAWAWLRLERDEKWNENNPQINVIPKEQRFGPPLGGQALFWMGGRLVPDFIWQEQQRAKGR